MSSKNKRESKGCVVGAQKDDEDVPPDFFDDFADDDFLDGLDVVDAWEEKEKSNKLRQEAEKEKSKRTREKKPSDVLAKSSTKSSLKEKTEKSTKTPESCERRNPEKTRKAIELDKENTSKRAKSKEKQRINERLKVAETGLVPPGMELEFLDELLNNSKSIEKKFIEEQQSFFGKEKKPIIDQGEKPLIAEKTGSPNRRRRSSKSRSNKSIEAYRIRKNKSSERMRIRSPDRLRNRSPQRMRNRSPPRKDFRISGKSRDRSREKKSSRDRSWERFREELRKFNNSPSPYRSRKRSNYSRSPSIGRKTRTLRVRSPSPERKYHFKDLEKKQMSFLEEVQLELNNKRSINPPAPNYIGAYSNVPTPVPPVSNIAIRPDLEYGMYPISTQPMMNQHYNYPQSAPSSHLLGVATNEITFPHNSNYLLEQESHVSLYDKNFFIGETNAVAPESKPTLFPIEPVPPPSAAPKMSDAMAKLMDNLLSNKRKDSPSKEANKLFEEKKISLSEFLSISSKPEVHSTNPEELKKKVLVISRCQDTIKLLNQSNQVRGKLKIINTQRPEKPQRIENQSPLLLKTPIEFDYTTKKNFKESTSFRHCLEKILTKVGVKKDKAIEVISSDSETEIDVPKPPIFSTKVDTPIKLDPPKKPMMIYKSTQTETVRCEECFRRKGIIKFSAGVQCVKESVDCSVQVCEADIVIETIPTNQSLASLTPAQLMGRSEKNIPRNPLNFEPPRNRINDQGFDNRNYDNRDYEHLVLRQREFYADEPRINPSMQTETSNEQFSNYYRHLARTSRNNMDPYTSPSKGRYGFKY